MFLGLTSPCTSACLVAPCRVRDARGVAREIRVRARGGDEIGFESDREEDVIGGKQRAHRAVACGGGVDVRHPPTDLRGERGIDVAVAQLRLPHRMLALVQVRHCEHAGRAVLAQDARDRVGLDSRSGAHPLHFPAVALDRRLPVGLDLEPGRARA